MRLDREKGYALTQYASTHIDVAAVHAVADRISAAADIIDDAVSNHLSRLTFDGACAGRTHVARVFMRSMEWQTCTTYSAILRGTKYCCWRLGSGRQTPSRK